MHVEDEVQKLQECCPHLQVCQATASGALGEHLEETTSGFLWKESKAFSHSDALLRPLRSSETVVWLGHLCRPLVYLRLPG